MRLAVYRRCSGLVLHAWFRQVVGAVLIWTTAMTSLPVYAQAQDHAAAQNEWPIRVTVAQHTPSQGSTASVVAPAKKAELRRTRSSPAGAGKAELPLAQARDLSLAVAPYQETQETGQSVGPRLSLDAIKQLGDQFHQAKTKKENPQAGPVMMARAMTAPVLPLPKPGLASPNSLLPSSASTGGPHSGQLLKAPLNALLFKPFQSQVGGLAVFVGYADDLRANPNFPVPWQGSPNTTFIGNVGPGWDTGAIRLDNNTDSPITIDDVFVTVPGWTTSDRRDAQGNGIADLWGSFTIPPHGTVIVAQTSGNNFDTSDFGVRGCGDTLANGQAPIPTVKITIGGVATTFSDTAHVLDTGGFDLACRGNESLQWRLIGTSGIENSAGHITLSPPTSVQPVGVTYTATAQVTDASNSPTPNVSVTFTVLNGPNAGKTGRGTTDSQGNATFSYTSASLGTDILQASVTNVVGGSIKSEQVTATWTTADPCPTPTGPPDPTQTAIVNAGPAVGEFNDPLILAAQLTDGNGAPLSGRSLSFTFGSQTFQASTDGNGIATANIVAAPAPGSVPLTVNFAGETGFKPTQLSTTINLDREETALRYTGGTLLGTVVPQHVSAVLIDPVSGTPIANETINFRVSGVQVQAVTNAQGVAATTIVLGADQTTGPTAIQVSFAGDSFYKPSLTGIPVTVYLSTSFVVWGGNPGGVRLGQDVNFWGSQWASQVTGGNFNANPSFKGFADPVNQVHVCEAGAGSGGPLDDQCWHSKPGNSFPPPLTVPAYIEVIISNAITKQGSEIFGNIAAAAVCKVDPTPVYAPDPGHPGFCTLTAVVEDGAGMFPQPPALTATQTQPATVLPGQNFNVTATVSNGSPSVANSVVVNENFDGLSPQTATQSFTSIVNGAQQTATFQVTSPVLSLRQSNESSLAYQQRLAAADGRLFTSTGTISFTDSVGQPFLPITVSSLSRLQLPELTVGISGPSCVGPGSKIPYKVTVGNIGAAVAQNVFILLKLPDGTNGTASIASIPAGGSVTTTINFVVPAISSKQPNETDQQYLARLAGIDGSTLVATAKVNWQDAQGNSYGAIEQQIVSTIERVPILSVTPQGPATLLPGQKATLNFTVQNNGGGNSSQVLLQVTNPDGSIVNIPAFALQGGQATTVSSTFTVPGAAKLAGESDAAYLARLSTLDNSTLKFTTQLRWFDAATNPYGPTSAGFQSTEILPVLTVSLTGPTTTFSTNNVNYFLRTANIGHADAASFSVKVQLPDGSVVNPFPASVLLAGSIAEISIPFGIPGSQPTGQLAAVASLNWNDAAANNYGPQSAAVVSANTHLDLPVISAGPNQSITTNSTVLNGSVTDNQLPPGGTLASTWKQIGGPAPVMFGSPSSPVTQATFTADGTYVVQLVASVANTNLPLTASANATIVVNAPTGGGGAGGGGGGSVVTQVLQGAIGQPLAGTVVQGQVAITVAAGTTLTSGVLDFWPTSNPSNLQVLNANVTGTGTIGTFDASTLQNGGYIVRLTATDSNGNTQASLITLNVIGENKPGRVTFTVVDFKVPLAGIPISIERTYDSLKRGNVGDFGFGWTLSTNMDLSVDAANNVTLTFNGKRDTFFFQPQPEPFPFSFLLTPNYVPQPGFHGSLTSDGCGVLVNQGGVTCFLGGAYQPTTFTYTDPAGRVYIVTADGQIKSIKDLNGNLISFTPAGITSNALGITVGFARDGQGRITQITDFNGNSFSYTYDSAGNLSAISLPGISTPATYTYDSSHLVLTKTDPRGNTSSASYFPDGRLQSFTDSQGNVTQYSYNLATNSTTITNPDGGVTSQTNNSFGKPLSITDALNRTTTFTYDTNHNLLTQIDPLGGVTTYTYDANGFQTSVKDPLGNTSRKIYNQFGGVTSETDALNNTRTTSYDPNFNPTQWSDSLGQIQSATYDVAGNLASLTNGNGKTTHFIYDSRGNLTQVVAPLNQTTSSTYDAMDRIATQTDARQKSTTFVYDAVGNLSDKIDAARGKTHYVYDGNGNKISETDALQRTTTYQYDPLNRLAKVTYPDQTTKQFTYDFRGNKLTETDQLQRVTKYAYDLAGQLSSVTYAFGTADAATVFYTYDADGRKLTETDGRGNITTYSYDAAGRVTSITDALNNVTTYTYDAAGRRTSAKDPNQHSTSFGYDVRARLKTVTYNDLTTTAYTYDGMGNQLTITDQANRTTTKNYDGLNRLISVQDPLQQLTQYAYDAANNLTSITDANLHTTSFQYDDLNRRTLRQLPLGMTESSLYDAVSNISSRTDFNGKTTTYLYDSMNRLISKTPDSTLNEPPIKSTYTATGKRATLQDANGLTTYKYDNRDRLITKITPQGTLSYTYDGAGNVLTITSSNVNGASLSYAYDARDRLATVTDLRLLAHGAASGVTTYSYDPAGNLLNYTYPNTVQTGYTYDTLNRLLTMVSTCGSSAGCGGAAAPIAAYTYTLGGAGNRLSVAELNGRAVTYGYDDLYRLTSEVISADPAAQNGTVSYTYDPATNRTQRISGVPAIPVTGVLTYDANDRTTSNPYDANGNLLLSGTGNNVYDFENRLIQSGAVNIVYDGEGNRVSVSAGGITTSYLVDTLNPTGYPQVLEELVNGSVTRTYSFGLQRISQNQLINSTWTPSFYAYDGHASVRSLQSLTGAVTDTYEFDAFGNLIAGAGTTPNSYLFSGEQFDSALHLYYLRARYLNPSIGTFLTKDPHEGVITDPNTLHSYVFANANPVNNIDPSGLDVFEYTEEVEISFSNHGLIHLIEEGHALSQAEVEAYVEQLVREILQEITVNHGAVFDVPFLMSQLGNVPWAARVFILSDAFIRIGTYFPINR